MPESFSSFDEPEVFGAGDVEYASGSSLDIVKENIGKIIIVIVLLAVAFSAYDYFIASIKTVSISVGNYEGESISASIKVFAPGESKAVYTDSGKSSFSFQLRAGEYSLDVSAPGYKKRSGESLTVSKEEDTSQSYKMEKNIAVKIEQLEAPAQIIQGEALQVPITFKNSSQKSETISLDLEPKELDISSSPEEIVVPGNSTAAATINIAVPESFDAGKSGKSVDLKVRIRYLKKEEEAKIRVLPRPEIELAGNKTQKFSASAGETKREDIKIENDSRFDITGLTLEVEITDSGENSWFGDDTIRNWFKLTDTTAEKWKLEIPIIKERDELKHDFYIEVPLNAKEGLVRGKFVLKADYLNPVLETRFELKIRGAAEVELEVKPTSRLARSTGFEIELNPETYSYNEYRDECIDVYNKGDVDIENIGIEIITKSSSSGYSCSDWVGFQSSNRISKLAKGEKEELNLLITVPASVPIGTQLVCKITYNYTHPLTLKRESREVGQDIVLKTVEG